jgi:hypothetical protein
MTKTTMPKYNHQYWNDFKITEADWTSLAYLVNFNEKRGVKMKFLSKLTDDRPGLELTFESCEKKPIVLNLAGNGSARVEFYRHWDKGPEQVKLCGDVKKHWQQMGQLICNLR